MVLFQLLERCELTNRRGPAAQRATSLLASKRKGLELMSADASEASPMRQTMILGPCVLFSMSLRLVVGAGSGDAAATPPDPLGVLPQGLVVRGSRPPHDAIDASRARLLHALAPAAARSRWTDKEGATSRTHTLRAAQLLGNEAQRALGRNLPHAFPTELFAGRPRRRRRHH